MFDIIITTNNRPETVLSLVKDILSLDNRCANLIIVDSSESENKVLREDCEIKYIRSSYKCQPYQRYLGFLVSCSDHIIFLDDDLRLKDRHVFTKMMSIYEDIEDVVGVTARVRYHSGLFVNDEVRSITKNMGITARIMNRITFNDIPIAGKLGLSGNGGGYPETSTYVDYFPGPVMSFKREIINDLFNNNLFAAYVKGLGKGEDKYISVKANDFGRLYCLSECDHFEHPPIVSSYNTNLKDFQKRVTFSRYMLMKRIGSVRQRGNIYVLLQFIWYTFFRILGSFNNLRRLQGQIIGIKTIILYGCKPDKFDYFVAAKKDSKFINFDE